MTNYINHNVLRYHGVDKFLVCASICYRHTSPEIEHIVTELRNTYKERDHIFPLYISNFCLPEYTHLCEVRFCGKITKIDAYIKILNMYGFVHDRNMLSNKLTYAIGDEINDLCMFLYNYDPHKYKKIAIRFPYKSADRYIGCLKQMVVDI